MACPSKRHPRCLATLWHLQFLDPDHSVEELRLLTMGCSAEGRLIVVSHTDRGEDIRIISARPETRGEKKRYEQDS